MDGPESISALRNRGPISQEMLAQAGITTVAQLRSIGAVAAYAPAKSVIPGVRLNLPWALESALTGLPWQGRRSIEAACSRLYDERLKHIRKGQTMLASLKAAARRIKQDSLTVYFAARDPRTPLLVRALALLVAAYALSPIDLIPDFIPVLGYLDDVLLLPLGILLVIRLTPAEVIAASRARAAELAARPASRAAAVVIVGLWLACAAAAVHWLWRN